MNAQHTRQSGLLKNKHHKRRKLEDEIRKARLRGGLFGLWDWLTGTRKKTISLNELEAAHMRRRDRQEFKTLRDQQLQAIKSQAEKAKAARINHYAAIRELESDIKRLRDLPDEVRQQEQSRTPNARNPNSERPRRRNRSRDGPSRH